MPGIIFERLHKEAILPHRATGGSVGYDIHALSIAENGRPHSRILARGQTASIETGLRVAAPLGFFLMVCSRSGLAGKGVHVINSPGIIDPDYRGELRVLLHNAGHQNYFVEHEERIAQILILPTVPEIEILEGRIDPSETERGGRGFGSTGR